MALARLPALRALTAVVRDRPDPRTRRELVRLAKAGPTLTSQTAIEALGAMADPGARSDLRALAKHPDPARRAAAIAALARVEKRPSVFLAALRSRDDRVAGAAARALANVGGLDKHVDPLLAAIRRAGVVTQINASAALARHLPAGRAPAARALLHHRNPVVRANAIFALGRLKVDGARRNLETLLADDNSWLVRAAAARALSRIGGSQVALGVAAKNDGNQLVREEAARALEVVFNPDPPNEWRNFLFVDPSTGGSPVADQAYVIIGSDGIGIAVFSDARGEAIVESFPPGRQWARPANRLSEL
jgi:HEAT repeat protein